MPSEKTSLAADMWIRARVNAMAHKFAAQQFERHDRLASFIVALLTVVPILTVALLFEFYQSQPTDVPDVALGAKLASWRNTLITISFLANTGSLFLGLWLKDLKLSERASQHRSQMTSYGIIAQKVRRLDDSGLDRSELSNSLRHLQELFEMYKSNPCEPDAKTFRDAVSEVSSLAPLPFGITRDDDGRLALPPSAQVAP